MPERDSALLLFPASRAGEGAGEAESDSAAAVGRLSGEAAGDLALQGGAPVSPGESLQVRGKRIHFQI
jgi:hypothetical protein